MCAVNWMRGQLGEGVDVRAAKTFSPQCIPVCGIVKAKELNNNTLPLHVFDDVMTNTSHAFIPFISLKQNLHHFHLIRRVDEVS